LAAVTAALDLAVEKVVNFINGKSISELWQPNFSFPSFVICNCTLSQLIQNLWDLSKNRNV
jgi:hypothetical protein